MREIAFVVALALTCSLYAESQAALQADAPHREWKAAWITHPTVPLRELRVLHFRRTVERACGDICKVLSIDEDAAKQAMWFPRVEMTPGLREKNH